LRRQNAATAAKETKDGNRTTLEGAERTVVRKIQATPSVTDTAAAITVPDTTPTPSGPPATAPVPTIRSNHFTFFSVTAWT